MTDLKTVWAMQKNYNDRIRKQEPGSYEHWMKNYLLGAISEVDEILNEMSWKAHRRGKPMNPHNLARELADLTKYVFSMWEWSGFDAATMLQFVEDKSHEMELQRIQDFDLEIPAGAPVLITDIDGTLGDWRRAFVVWLKDAHAEVYTDDIADNMAIEVNLGIPYPKYARLKEQFEAEGGYTQLPLYPEVADVLYHLWQTGTFIIAYTARPARKHSRIWADTWSWLAKQRLDGSIRELNIGAEERISRACELQDLGHPVLLWEDDPSLALRAAHTGLSVMLRAQPYNSGVKHPNIVRVASFPSFTFESVTKGDPK